MILAELAQEDAALVEAPPTPTDLADTTQEEATHRMTVTAPAEMPRLVVASHVGSAPPRSLGFLLSCRLMDQARIDLHG